MTIAINKLLSTQHAIEPSALMEVLAIAERFGSSELAAERREERAGRRRVMLDAVQTKPLQSVNGTRYARQRGSVAVLEVNGPIYRYASMFDDISAMTSVQRLAVDFQTLLDTPAISTILLLVDSPGGEVDGIHQFAEMVYAARDKKRIVSYIDGDGASAAYWILAAASEVYMDTTARAGSIGVRMSMRDPKQSRQGMYVLVDSEAPDKDPDPATQEGMAELRRNLEPLAAIFRADVAKYRGIDEADIRALRGGVRVGQEAVDAGLVDGLTAFETLMDDLLAGGSASAKKGTAMTDEQLLAALTAATPEQSNSLLDGLKMKAEVGPKLDALIEANTALMAAMTTSNEAHQATQGTLTSLVETVEKQASTINALDARLKALEGEQPAASGGGYRASQSGEAPDETLKAQQPQVVGIDAGFMNFLVKNQ